MKKTIFVIAFSLIIVMAIAVIEAFIIFAKCNVISDQDKTITRLIKENAERGLEVAILRKDLDIAELNKVSIDYKDYTKYSQK